MTPSSTTLSGDPPVEIALNRRPSARRLSLRVSSLDGRVTLSMPARLDVAVAQAFLREREGWLRKALAQVPARVPVGAGGVVPFRGVGLELVPGSGRGIRQEGARLLLPADPSGGRSGPRVAAWLKLQARADLETACARHAGVLGRGFGPLVLGDTRSRWGSCTAQGRLMFSWRLVMAPPPVLDYVAAHEVAHLLEMNHSPAFWAVVTRLLPDWKRARGWLRTHGAELHRFDFAPRGPSAGRLA